MIHIGIGKRFGRLLVLKETPIRRNGRLYWDVVCACGTRKVVSQSHLGKTTFSCGCKKTKHGMKNTRTYHIWENMKQRCLNSKNPHYKNYGLRGIKICKEWLTFKGFLKDMGIAKETLTIERIDNNGNYEPGNCKWATRKEQNNNHSRNFNITYGGETMNITQWSEKTGIKRNTIDARIHILNWKPERAVSIPVRKSQVCVQ